MYEYPLIGFEPAISLVTEWSPSRIVGSGGMGEELSAEPGSSALAELPKASAEPVAAAESLDRNSLRPIPCVSCFSVSMLGS
jgi:hypothetical protein